MLNQCVENVLRVKSECDRYGMPLGHIVATYTMQKLKRLRQLAVEIHYASVKHPKVRQVLRRSLDHNIEQIRDGVAAMQRAGKLDQTIDSESLACVIMGLMHMETLLPQLVGDAKWHDFVQDRAAALMGMPDSGSSRRSGERSQQRSTKGSPHETENTAR
ncbi:MAG: hypothetical protein WB696_09900 [Chthoniobacterales bacterium]